jgi:hypothetical protein
MRFPIEISSQNPRGNGDGDAPTGTTGSNPKWFFYSLTNCFYYYFLEIGGEG